MVSRSMTSHRKLTHTQGALRVPASLAVGEREHLSGKDLLAGVALASEVISRVGESGMRWMLARGFHETCILGVFGSAAVAGKMLGLDPDQITNALSIAGSHASGTREFSQTGGDVKRVHAGLGANGGIRSALLARNGLTGPPSILEGKLGVLQSFGGQFAEDKLTGGLGDRYAMVWNGFKPYCCSIDQHSYIDATTRILAAHPLGPENIAEIVARITPFEMGHIGTIGPEPHDITGAQLSVHFALGLTVAKRSNDFNTYIDAMNSGFKDPGVLAVARKVSVVEIPEPKDGDFLRAGSLTVKTNDGKT